MKKKTISEQVKHNVEQYIRMKNGEPNSAKVINVDFLNLVEEISDKNSETLAALAEIEKGNLPSYETVDELFYDLNQDEDKDMN